MPRHGRGWGMRGAGKSENRHSPITVSLLEPALLIMLSKQPSHGYTLLSEINKIDMTTIQPSVVYRSLREMEELMWIESDWDSTQTQGPPRRIYHLTEQGIQALQYWKAELEKTNATILQLLKNI